MMNAWSLWLHVYLYSLDRAAANAPAHYFSRIDGALLPAEKEVEEDE
jgi:hypothetical protein